MQDSTNSIHHRDEIFQDGPLISRLNNIAVVLHRTRYPENVGSVARCALNMGISRILLVNPLDVDMDRMLKLATWKASHLIGTLRIYDSLEEALAPFGYIIGTTARKGGHRQESLSPKQMASRIASISRENQVALLFGPEDRGLTNKEIRFCHVLVTIPTAGFSSLNLSHSVAILCYEILQGLSNRMEEPPAPRAASCGELEAMYEHLKDTLIKIGVIQRDNAEHWMLKIRRFLSRRELQSQEVRFIRGVCRQIDWYAGRRLRRLLEQKRG